MNKVEWTLLSSHFPIKFILVLVHLSMLGDDEAYLRSYERVSGMSLHLDLWHDFLLTSMHEYLLRIL